VPKKIRVHELAKELGLTNKEALDLALSLGIDAKSHSSSIEDAQADRVRRKATREGLVRDQQPEEAAAPAKRTSKKAAAKAEAVTTPAEPASVATIATVEPVVEEPPAAPTPRPNGEPPAATPVVEPAAAATVAAPEREAKPEQAPAATEPAVHPPGGEHRIISSSRQVAPLPITPPPARTPSRPTVPPPGRPAAPAARSGTAAPPRPAAPDRPADPGEAPLSPSGKPIPPPPGRPLSPSGRPIPPPPGGPRPVTRSGGAGGPRPGVGRPTGAGGRGPGPSTRPGGFAGPRPGGGPSTGFGAPRPGGGPRPTGGRRPPKRRGGRRRRNLEELQPQQLLDYRPSTAPVPEGTIIVERGSSAQEYAPKLNRSTADVIRFLLQQGEMVTATQALTDEQVELYAIELGAEVLLVDPGQQEEMELQALFDDSDDEDESLLEPRPAVITVMGHVDHGKTTLLDKIRATNVVAGEAGGITQHIGAYQVERDGHLITFIDTPGHAAFTKMRARGAEVTDIVVLVVAADDGVMPQTVEAIEHARAAEVPIVVGLNKIDKDNADPQRVLTQLAEHELVPEAWGGDTIVVEMSAQQGLGIDDLLDQLLVVAEIEELAANPTGRAKGVVLEANLDAGRGPVATVLVDKGSLAAGDPIVAGAAWGRVRAMLDDSGEQIKEAGPSTPVVVLGLSSVPNAGDEFRVAPNEKTARMVGEAREQRFRLTNQRADARVQKGVKLEEIFSQIQRGEVATLNLVLKADVQGSLEALTESLRKLERDDVKPVFVRRAVGGITENDINIAATTTATIIGFNVRPDRKVRELAEAEGVEIRTYEVIYQIIEDIERAMVGLLAPEFEEIVTGEAEVREIFRVPRVGAIAGCYVQSGTITRGSKVRFLREGTIIWKGAIQSLKRFKDDVREVREGFGCGIGLSDFQDLKQGDVIETFEEREIART
jgi:translation initiation factor IF-2